MTTDTSEHLNDESGADGEPLGMDTAQLNEAMRAVAEDEEARSGLFRRQGMDPNEEEARARRYREDRAGMKTATGEPWTPDLTARKTDAESASSPS